MEITINKEFNSLDLQNNTISNSPIINGKDNNVTINYEIDDRKNKIDYTDYIKKYLANFKQLENYIFRKIFNLNQKDIEYNSYENCLKEVINWILGLREYPKENIKEMHEEIHIKNIKIEDSLEKRWIAMDYFFSGNKQKAKDIYSSLLDEIDEINSKDKYYLDDILIDGRNIFDIFDNEEFQSKIEGLNHVLTAPLYDRLKNNIYEKANKNLFSISVKSKNTIIYGYGLETIFNDLQDYISITLFYGSITHLLITRKILHFILSLYANQLNDAHCYEKDIEMLILLNSPKEAESLIEKLISKEMINFDYCLNNILKFEKSLTDEEKFNYYSNIIYLFGKYLKKDDFDGIYNKFFSYLNKKKLSTMIVNKYLKSIVSCINRIENRNELFDIILKFNKTELDYYNINIINIINSIYFEKLDSKEIQQLIDIINKLIKNENNIVKLINSIVYLKDKFGCNEFDEILNKQEYKIYYSIEKDDDRAYITKKIIEHIKEKHLQVEQGQYGIGIEYSFDKTLFEDSKDIKQIEQLIKNEYFPLAKSILSSKKETIHNKINQMKNISYFLYSHNTNEYKKMINEIINDISYESMKFDDENDENKLAIYIDMLKFMINKISQEEYLEKFYILLHENHKLIELINFCIQNVKKFFSVNDEYSTSLYMLFLLSINDKNDIDVRYSSYHIASLLLDTNYNSKVISIIKERSKVCEAKEALGIIKILKFDKEKIKDSYKEIYKNLLNSLNYNIKIMTEVNLKSN